MANFYDIEPEPQNGIGSLIRKLRQQKKYSLREFCDKLGVDPGNWSKFERGKEKYFPLGKVEQTLTLLDITGDMQEYHDVYSALVKQHPDPDVRRYIIEILGVK